VLSDIDGHQLEDAQQNLITFGLDSPPDVLAKHIYESTVFSSILSTALYPVLKPTKLFGIHQKWE
jgi:hypothetical protein